MSSRTANLPFQKLPIKYILLTMRLFHAKQQFR